MQALRYTKGQLETIRELTHARGIAKLDILPWPMLLDGESLTRIDSLDWAIVDVGPEAMKTGLVGYLHGQFLPMIRLFKGIGNIGAVEAELAYRSLFGGVEVGYPKDIVCWKGLPQLRSGLSKRLSTLLTPPKRVSTYEEAVAYFKKAALRKETVFLSYSGHDAETAARFSTVLKEKFQKVFDYKDGESIRPGKPWLEEIFETLSGSALGIPLVSPSYLESRNCIHEAEEMVARQDSGKMYVAPIKLYPGELERPSWMRDRQYLHLYDYRDDVEKAVDRIVGAFDADKTA